MEKLLSWKTNPAASVGLEKALSQGAYMLLYSRVSAHPTYLTITEPSQKEQQVENMDVEPNSNAVQCSSNTESVGLIGRSESLLPNHNSHARVPHGEDESSFVADSRAVTKHLGDNGFLKTSSNSHLVVSEISDHGKESSLDVDPHIVREDPEQMDNMANTFLSTSDHKDLPNETGNWWLHLIPKLLQNIHRVQAVIMVHVLQLILKLQ